MSPSSPPRHRHVALDAAAEAKHAVFGPWKFHHQFYYEPNNVLAPPWTVRVMKRTIVEVSRGCAERGLCSGGEIWRKTGELAPNLLNADLARRGGRGGVLRIRVSYYHGLRPEGCEAE